MNYTGAEAYYNNAGKPFKAWEHRAYLSIDVLPLLKGKPWDDLALSYVSALRPSLIRVIKWGEGQAANAVTWRVTVNLDENNLIRKITQEVEVCVPEGCTTGYSIMMAAQFGIGSPQVEWCNKPGGITIGFGEMYKTLDDGTILPFPQ
jgi:hypothetical protein